MKKIKSNDPASKASKNAAAAPPSKWAPNLNQQPDEVKLTATSDSSKEWMFLSLRHDVLVIRRVESDSISTFDIPVETLTVSRKKSAQSSDLLARARFPVVVFQFAVKLMEAEDAQEVKFKCWLPFNKNKRAAVEKLLSGIELARQKTTGKLEGAVVSSDEIHGRNIMQTGCAIILIVCFLAAGLKEPWFLLGLLIFALPLWGFLLRLKNRKRIAGFAELENHLKNYRWDEALAWMQAYEAEDPARRGGTAHGQIGVLIKMNRHGDALECLDSYKDVFSVEDFMNIRDDLLLRMNARMRKETGTPASVWF
jgi:Thiol:disulfide interchange protein